MMSFLRVTELNRQILFMSACVAALVTLSPSHLEARGGLYLGFDLGGAKTNGALQIPVCSNTTLDYCIISPASQVKTDFGSGFAFGFKFGYNIMGFGGLEANINAHGSKKSAANSWEGLGHIALVARLFPVQFLTLAKNYKLRALHKRAWDPNIYFGYGFLDMGGYHVAAGEGRGWEGTHFQWGLGFDYKIASTVSVGIDFKFIHPQLDVFLLDWDPRETVPLKKPEKPFIFAPMANITFHVWDPHK